MELSSQSEIQHLSSKLERANDTICANELEIERLTMRINDLVGTNMTVMQQQQQKEEKLRESEKLLAVCFKITVIGEMCVCMFQEKIINLELGSKIYCFFPTLWPMDQRLIALLILCLLSNLESDSLASFSHEIEKL